MNNKLIAIHQPNYLPWMGYFLKMVMCDVFVLLDNVQFSTDSLTKRVRIASNQSISSDQWLSIPVIKAPLNTAIDKITIDGNNWVDLHIAKLKQTYNRHPFYFECITIIRDIYTQLDRSDTLADVNIKIIRLLANYLEIKTTIVNANDLNLIEIKSDMLLISIVKQLAGNIYLSGQGGKNYQSQTLFNCENISIEYVDSMNVIKSYNYKQVIPTPNYGVSIIDMWMNVGLEGIKSFLSEHVKK